MQILHLLDYMGEFQLWQVWCPGWKYPDKLQTPPTLWMKYKYKSSRCMFPNSWECWHKLYFACFSHISLWADVTYFLCCKQKKYKTSACRLQYSHKLTVQRKNAKQLPQVSSSCTPGDVLFSTSLKGVQLTRCVVGLETHPWWGQDYMLISGQVLRVPDMVNRYLRSFYPERLWTVLKRVTRPLRLAQEPSVQWMNWLVVMAVLYAWASLVRSVWRSTQSIWCGRQRRTTS